MDYTFETEQDSWTKRLSFQSDIRFNYKVKNYERKNYLIGTNFRVALIPWISRFKKKNRELKATRKKKSREL